MKFHEKMTRYAYHGLQRFEIVAFYPLDIQIEDQPIYIAADFQDQSWHPTPAAAKSNVSLPCNPIGKIEIH